MGIETFGEKGENTLFKKDFSFLEKKEKQEKKKVTDFFQENAQLSLLLASEGTVHMTEHQKRYYLSQLGNLRLEAKETFRELREVTGTEIPAEMRDLKAADNYYKEIKKAA